MIKTPEQIAREAIDREYGIGTRWEEPDDEGREGFARAQAETLAETGEHIEADDVRRLIESAVEADREQRSDQDRLEAWIAQLVEPLASDKSNDWSEELDRLRAIRPDLLEA